MTALRWGFMGTGWIARTVADDFSSTDMRIEAVGSSSLDQANAFGDDFQVPNRHGSYAALAADPAVDIVYVTLLNQAHMDGALLAIDAGKHVLVEKPFTINQAQAERVRAAAQARGVMVMEAMWSRFLPMHETIRGLISGGAIGDVLVVTSQLSQNQAGKPRLWDPTVGGGAMLDLGIYCLSFTVSLLGMPERVTARATITDRGVDETTAVVLEYPDSRQGTFMTSMRVSGPAIATILGSTGRIDIGDPLWGQSGFTVCDSQGIAIQEYSVPVAGTGRQFQALEFERCLRAGLLESPKLPISESVQIMGIMDAIRREVGVVYPMD